MVSAHAATGRRTDNKDVSLTRNVHRYVPPRQLEVIDEEIQRLLRKVTP